MLAVSVVIGSPDLFSRRHPGRGRRSSPYDAKQDVSVTARSAISPVAAPCSPPRTSRPKNRVKTTAAQSISRRESYIPFHPIYKSNIISFIASISGTPQATSQSIIDLQLRAELSISPHSTKIQILFPDIFVLDCCTRLYQASNPGQVAQIIGLLAQHRL